MLYICPVDYFICFVAFTQVNFSNFISKGVWSINALYTPQKEIRLYTGVCDAVSSPRPFNVLYVTIKVNVLLESFDLVARHDTSHCSTDRFFFFVFFFNTKDDAKVEREVSETVTLCFVSAGCKAG